MTHGNAAGFTSPEDELMLRLSGTAARRAEERGSIERLGHAIDSDRLLTRMEQQRLVALLGTRLEATLPGRLPESFRAAVAERVARNRHRGALFAHLTEQLCQELAAAGIISVALKGVGLAERAHGDLGLRASPTDIDLLVEPRRLQDAVRVLVGMGCTIIDNIDWGGDLPHYHARLAIHDPIEARIEVHWRVHWYEDEFAREALARSTPVCGGMRELLPVDEFALLLAIFARDGFLGLRLPADIAAWWDRHDGDCPEPALEKTIGRHPQLRDSLLAASVVLGREVGLPSQRVVGATARLPRRVELATRLADWSQARNGRDRTTDVMLSDLLLTPRGAHRVFLRHYYLQPLDHYLAIYGWPSGRMVGNHALRFGHAAGRIGHSCASGAWRLWQIWTKSTVAPPPSSKAIVRAGGGQQPRLLVISPVRNESAHIERVARSVASQTRQPDLWLVADDGSDDGTPEILRELEAEIPFLKAIHLKDGGGGAPDRLAEALEAKAFNRALREADGSQYTHIAKLDGDVELPPNYFERLLAQMDGDPRLGIVGGSIVEPGGRSGAWKAVTAPEYHVHGALKLFSRECFEAVGGIQERLGWDTIDETYARMRGFRTRRDRTLVARHHRPSASADGKLRGRMRHGECAYIARYSLPWVILRSFKVGLRQEPFGISAVAFVWGYIRCAIRRADHVDDEEFKRFVRAEHRRRVLRALSLRTEAGSYA